MIATRQTQTVGAMALTSNVRSRYAMPCCAATACCAGIWKRYTAVLSEPLEGKEADKAIQRFASGQLQLQNDRTPLLPAALHMVDPTTAEVSICEGRYHQIRRMFAAVGRTVVALHRHTIGGLSLPPEQDLPLGQWRLVTQADIDAVMAGPESFAAAKQQQQQPAGESGQQQQPQRQQEVSAAGQLQQQADADRHSVSGSNSSRSRPAAAGSSDTGTVQGRGASHWDNDVGDSHSSSDTDEDVDHPGEVAAAVKRFKSSTKRARRRAVLVDDVRAIRMQQQRRQQQQQQQPDAAGT
jgi:hypothetical protein